MTPAMASEPYWAEAPSRRISTRSIADCGMAEISAPVSPRPGDVWVYRRALVFLRFPLIRISVRLGPMLRIS